MPVQHKRSKEPGDNKDMMQARRLFLEQNHYQAMQKKVSSLCNELLVERHYRLLDIGCGEGYYTSAIADSLQRSGTSSLRFRHLQSCHTLCSQTLQ